MKVLSLLASLALLAASVEAGAATAPTAPAPVKDVKKCKAKPHKHYHDVILPIPKDAYEKAPTGPADNSYKLKTGPNGEYLGDSRGEKQVNYQKMHTVPVPRKGYEPRKTVNCAYIADVPGKQSPTGKDGVMVADMKVTTKTPTVNLDNLESIKTVQCAEDSMTLTFNSDASADAAAAEWNKSKDFAVLVGHEWNCNGDKNSNARIVKAVKSKSGATVVLSTNKVKKETVIDEYELNINQYITPEGVGKRSFWNWQRDRTHNMGLYVNFDKNTRAPVRPDIKLLETRFGSVSCVDCYAYGEAALRIYVKGKTVWISEYKVELNGKLEASMGLRLQANQMAKTDLYRTTLWTLPLTPINVPGIFKFGPELRLKAGVEYECKEDLVVEAGVLAQLPFSWSMGSDAGIFKRPKITASSKPSLTPKLKASKDIDISVKAVLTPEFSLEMSVLSVGFDMSLGVENEWGASLKRGKYAGCPDGLQAKAWAKHDLDFYISGLGMRKEFTLWTTGVLGLNVLPDKCFPHTTTSLIATTTASASTSTSAATATTTSSASATETATGTTTETATATSSAVVTSSSATATQTSTSAAVTTTSQAETSTSSTSATATATSSAAVTSSSATATQTSTSAAATTTSAADKTTTSAADKTTTSAAATSTTSAATTTTSQAETSTSSAEPEPTYAYGRRGKKQH